MRAARLADAAQRNLSRAVQQAHHAARSDDAARTQGAAAAAAVAVLGRS
jgi:hypothetical protein